MTLLTPHFTLEELTHTDTGLRNFPDDETLDALRRTAHQMEHVRELLGHPIIVSSGYRSPAVNHAVRGAPESAHCWGFAVDFVCPGFGTPWEVATRIAGSPIKFDQLIREYGWVHLSFDPRLRGQKLTKRSPESSYEIGLNQ